MAFFESKWVPFESLQLGGWAGDVLRLLRQLRLFPHMLIGHSYGGKVGPLEHCMHYCACTCSFPVTM